ncbi:hypothetical protein Pcinc_028305 [Petrolisthes cinctipes]|uniref:Uncharacterized protein n=1 Tax=Petrolisthes cinctipes TaxID=88211 RepID=A0AAE1F251_PETCI|nr:hypothetical protein Pcinc_028305 [Petrolisthes cinctipes]
MEDVRRDGGKEKNKGRRKRGMGKEKWRKGGGEDMATHSSGPDLLKAIYPAICLATPDWGIYTVRGMTVRTLALLSQFLSQHAHRPVSCHYRFSHNTTPTVVSCLSLYYTSHQATPTVIILITPIIPNVLSPVTVSTTPTWSCYCHTTTPNPNPCTVVLVTVTPAQRILFCLLPLS